MLADGGRRLAVGDGAGGGVAGLGSHDGVVGFEWFDKRCGEPGGDSQ